MSLTRRRSDRPDPARRRLGSSLEALERRELLTGGAPRYYQSLPDGLPIQTSSVNLAIPPINHPLGVSDAVVAALGNSGKLVQGRDRAGNQYSIAVHGPGSVIVTDATPNDGVLDDDIDTIQIVGADPNKTTVIGSVSASAETLTNGTVFFNKLISANGVKSIVLNGFILTQTVPPPNGGLPNSNTGVFLPAGAHDLEFTGVQAPINTSLSTQPINIVIGDPNIPLKFKPSVRIDEISNTVFDSTSTVVPTGPLVSPTVNITINGEANNLQFVSATQQTEPAAAQFLFPIVGTTGRTSIQAKGINSLKFVGSAVNVTASQSATPFQGSFTGLSHLGSAAFGGNADALALDVSGNIGKLQFNKGLGNPTGLSKAATTFGTPAANIGYPGSGLLGGLVRAKNIGSIKAAPADTILLTSNNPTNLQKNRTGSTTFVPKAGHTLNFAAITASGNIGSATIVGDSTSSEVKTGFDLISYNQGLQGTRGPSAIKSIHYRGDLVDSAISASYQPSANGYGAPGFVKGPGTINGTFKGSINFTGAKTALGNTGVGFFAKNKPSTLP
jgi:hypothetical protein